MAPAPIAYHGMEYPQAIFLGVELYTRFRENLEVLTVHEMAHQWWYNIVHNDPVREPWLDEALAEFSVMIYMENIRGADDTSIPACAAVADAAGHPGGSGRGYGRQPGRARIPQRQPV